MKEKTRTNRQWNRKNIYNERREDDVKGPRSEEKKDSKWVWKK